MEQVNVELGKRIQTYRKAQGMTLEELAARICKSKSTVGKYEQGAISVDITVLLDLAQALGVRPQQLLAELEKPEPEAAASFSGGSSRYFYTYDGFFHRILRALMVIADPEQADSPVSLFYDIPAFDRPEHCRVLYVGNQERHETITKYLLKKRGGIESPQLCFTRPLDYQGRESGIFFGISSRTQLPVSLKCILSDEPLEEDQTLINQLLITPEDFRITRKVNQFMIEPGF